MTIKIAINIENAHGWHIGNNIFGGTSGKKSSGSSSEDNLNDADFEVVDEEPQKQKPQFLDMWAVLLLYLHNLKARKQRRFLRDWCELMYWMRIFNLTT